MVSMLFASLLVAVTVLSTSGTATAASAEMFPALRKRKLAAAQKATETATVPAPEVADVPDKVPSAAVPTVADVGSDGFPKLPEVSSMLSQASGTLKAVSSKASGLEAQVVQAQMQSESKMAKQKAAFEEKLKSQEEGNRVVIGANDKITAQIKELQSGNAALKKNAHEIEKTNKVMRTELQTLEARLGAARDFTEKSLSSTDDSKNALLQVLKKSGGHRRQHKALVEMASSSKKRKDDDDEDDDDSEDSSEDDKDDDESDDDDEGTSLLSLSRKVRRDFEPDVEAEAGVGPSPNVVVPAGAPGDLLEVLAKDVAHLAQQEKDSEKNLKNLFIRDFRAGAKRNKALLDQKKNLIATRDSLLNLQAQLKKAEAHVESTRTQLEARLHGLGQYLQKLAHFAMAPQKEVPHLLEVLPKAITVKAAA